MGAHSATSRSWDGPWSFSPTQVTDGFCIINLLCKLCVLVCTIHNHSNPNLSPLFLVLHVQFYSIAIKIITFISFSQKSPSMKRLMVATQTKTNKLNELPLATNFLLLNYFVFCRYRLLLILIKCFFKERIELLQQINNSKCAEMDNAVSSFKLSSAALCTS